MCTVHTHTTCSLFAPFNAIPHAYTHATHKHHPSTVYDIHIIHIVIIFRFFFLHSFVHFFDLEILRIIHFWDWMRNNEIDNKYCELPTLSSPHYRYEKKEESKKTHRMTQMPFNPKSSRSILIVITCIAGIKCLEYELHTPSRSHCKWREEQKRTLYTLCVYCWVLSEAHAY